MIVDDIAFLGVKDDSLRRSLVLSGPGEGETNPEKAWQKSSLPWALPPKRDDRPLTALALGWVGNLRVVPTA
jgi:hypothetical protein